MRRDEPAAFFAQQDPSGRILQRRAHWLDEASDLYLATPPGMGAITSDLWDLALASSQVEPGEDRSLGALSRQWEADLILLDVETFRVAGGCVCFPSSWSLPKATGKTLTEVHAVVPDLNDSLGIKVGQFLAKLSPGRIFLRENWGLTRTDHLNYHPALQRPCLDEAPALSEVFLRIEHQAFLRLPGAILLGVRIEPVKLSDLVAQHPGTAHRLRRQLETMPAAVADYKGLRRALPKLVALLRES